MKAIKNILVPVDFSGNSKAAFEYAAALAEDFKAETIKVLYVYDDYMPAAPFSDPLIIPAGKTEEDYKEDLINFVEEEENVLDTTLTKRKVKIIPHATIGKPVETIVQFSESGLYDLIVMGTTGKKTLGEIFFGSTATNVSQQADCPILLIPEGATYKGVKDIIYACDFDHKSTEHVKVVADIASTLKSDVDLLFVKTDENESKTYNKDANDLGRVFAQTAPTVKFKARIVEEDSVVEGVNRIGKEINADMVTVVTKHRSFWGRFIHSSMTKEMAMYAELPVLVVHVDA
jgi:nucleotide-binding universal stress UspA family protein